jgi:hypothetical protein
VPGALQLVDWGRTITTLWVRSAIVIGAVSVVGGFWTRTWFAVLFGIPWLSVAALMRLNDKDPLPVVDDPVSGATQPVSADHPQHLALFGLTVLAVGLLVVLPSLGVGELSSSHMSTGGVIAGGLFALAGAWLFAKGLYVSWRRGRRR